MNKYIATFYSHYGAMTYNKHLIANGVTAKLMPVPRSVSASCGTCVCFEHTDPLQLDDCEMEGIYLHDGEIYHKVT